MRHITLKIVKTRKDRQDGNGKIPLDYRKQIEAIVTEPIGDPRSPRGFDTATMRKSMRVQDALEAATAKVGNILKLEDADWEYLKGRVTEFQWPWADKVFLDFCDEIEKAPKDNPKEKPEKALKAVAAN